MDINQPLRPAASAACAACSRLRRLTRPVRPSCSACRRSCCSKRVGLGHVRDHAAPTHSALPVAMDGPGAERPPARGFALADLHLHVRGTGGPWPRWRLRALASLAMQPEPVQEAHVVDAMPRRPQEGLQPRRGAADAPASHSQSASLALSSKSRSSSDTTWRCRSCSLRAAQLQALAANGDGGRHHHAGSTPPSGRKPARTWHCRCAAWRPKRPGTRKPSQRPRWPRAGGEHQTASGRDARPKPAIILHRPRCAGRTARAPRPQPGHQDPHARWRGAWRGSGLATLALPRQPPTPQAQQAAHHQADGPAQQGPVGALQHPERQRHRQHIGQHQRRAQAQHLSIRCSAQPCHVGTRIRVQMEDGTPPAIRCARHRPPA